MRPHASRVWTVGLVVGVVGVGCGEESGRSPEAAPVAAEEEAPAVASSASAPPPTAFGCIRGGTSRAEVLQLMGQPDSVSYGVWLYGASEVAFGYGVVVDYSDADGRLALCAESSEPGPAGDARPR